MSLCIAKTISAVTGTDSGLILTIRTVAAYRDECRPRLFLGQWRSVTMQVYQITIDEYLQAVRLNESLSIYDPCDHCNRGWCYGCPHLGE